MAGRGTHDVNVHPPTVFMAVLDTTTRTPETSRMNRLAPKVDTGFEPTGALRDTAMEISLWGVSRSRSPCLAATSASLFRNGGSMARRRSSRAVQPEAPRYRSVRATSSNFSIPRGAKHEVVESTQSTLSAPTSAVLAARAGTSVRSSSPSSTFSIGRGVRPAAQIALRHDFWSILGHSTYVAFGRSWRSASRSSVTDIPVASGSVTASLIPVAPARLSASAASAFVSA
eukprot:scaffold278836_cov32-Tisochrysis_lutea.AAC.2